MSAATGPGVIVVAERPLYDALRSLDAPWWIQERQATVGGMWDALSGGRLDQRSRILIFSDSLMTGTASAEFEFGQTAQAVAARELKAIVESLLFVSPEPLSLSVSPEPSAVVSACVPVSDEPSGAVSVASSPPVSPS